MWLWYLVKEATDLTLHCRSYSYYKGIVIEVKNVVVARWFKTPVFRTTSDDVV